MGVGSLSGTVYPTESLHPYPNGSIPFPGPCVAIPSEMLGEETVQGFQVMEPGVAVDTGLLLTMAWLFYILMYYKIYYNMYYIILYYII